MAYDPKDPEDVKIVQKLVDAAVDKALEEKQTEHDADVAGLKKKNTDLLAKIAKGESSPEEITKLEGEIETLKAKMKDDAKAITKLTKERDEHAETATKESKFSTQMLTESALTDALLTNNIAKQFLPAAKALLAGQVSIKADGDKRLAVVGDKSLGDFVKEWSQGDEGKIYVAAPNNSGGGAPGGKADGGGKTMTRAAHDEMVANGNSAQAAKFFSEGGTLTEA